MTAYQQLQTRLPLDPRTWLVTGVAGFIGSNLLEALLKLGQRVVSLDNFAVKLINSLCPMECVIRHVTVINRSSCATSQRWLS